MVTTRLAEALRVEGTGVDENFCVAIGDGLDGTVVVTMAGELDLAGREAAEGALTRATDGGSSRVVVDLSRLTFIDSSGINALALGWRAASGRGGALVVRGAAGTVLRTLELSGLAEILDLGSP
jgi:anti-sigma B factor antagonist